MADVRLTLDELTRSRRWGYGAADGAAEPAAWAALALAVQGRADAALAPADWLAEIQQPSGAVGVLADQAEPCWPTGLALLAWRAVDAANRQHRYEEPVRRAVAWSLDARGEPGKPAPEVGHNSALIGWSWAAATHSWLEPTCFFTLGLRAAGLATHPRVREGVALVRDRLLPSGGANYGNTVVLGQELLPHVQASGIAMMALAGESIADARIGKTLDYLTHAVATEVAAASLSFACMGLAAHGRRPADANDRLAAALDPASGPPLSPYEAALVLAALAPRQEWLGELLTPQESAGGPTTQKTEG